METRPEYFIFDLDGTLFDTSLDLARSVNFALSSFGLPTHPVPDVVSFIGNGSMNLIRRSLPEEKMHLLPEIHRTFLAHYNENCTIDTKPYPGVMEFLNSDAPASILTNKPYAPTIRILAHFNLLGRFDHILCGDTAPARKPEPAGLRSILEQVGIAPERALMVGDDLPDIGVAKATGTPSMALLAGFGDAHDLREAKPTYMAENFSAFARMAQQ